MNSYDVKRKLTAILSADVQGYSRLMEDDEQATIETITVYRAIMTGLIEAQNGRVVDAKGDNVLAEFASIVDALQCAVEIQKEINLKNADLPENRRMAFRIGVNLGDVIEKADTIYGDGVNIAARLEGLAEGGGVCISGTAFDAVGEKLSLGYKFIGEQKVKNIKKPVRAYKVLLDPESSGKVIGEKRRLKMWHWTAIFGLVVLIALGGGLSIWELYIRPDIAPASVEKMAFPLPDKPSIAVLAFANMSGDPKDDLLGDALAEGIINALAKSNKIFVIARESSFSYKGKSVKMQQVAEEMGVQYVIEGSVQREVERVRITVQLIDALTGHHVFSERYDKDLKDILKLQDDIAMKVLTAVQVKLTVGEGARISEAGTKNLDAYLKVLEAQELKAGPSNKGNIQRAMQLCEEAIALDPNYPWAYVQLSGANVRMVMIGASDSPRESLRRAVELGKKAVALDESNSKAHAGLVFPYVLLRNFDKAIEEAEKSISLSPNSAAGYMALGFALYWAGRYKEAIPIFQKCLRLSPVPIHSGAIGGLAGSYIWLGQYEEAVVTCKKSLLIYGPDYRSAHIFLAIAYTGLGREDKARAEVAEVLRINPKFSVERYNRAMPFKDATLKNWWAESMKKAGLPN